MYKNKDIFFLGVVASYDEEHGYGMIQCAEATELFERDVYAFKDVLAFGNAGQGDQVRFPIHVNNRGQPQASLPLYKVGDDGEPIDGQPTDKNGEPIEGHVFAEEVEAENPGTLRKQYVTNPPGAGKGAAKGADKGAAKSIGKKRVADPWAGGPPATRQRSENGYAGAVETGSIDLKIDGIPGGVLHREIAHIFRQYAGFLSLRTADKGNHTMTFATFESREQALFVRDALNGYIFDDQAPQWEQSPLRIEFSTQPKGKGKVGKGKVKGY